MTATLVAPAELASAYLAHLERELVAPNTIAARKRTLTAVGMTRVGGISREDLEAWWYERAEVVSAATRKADLANLRTFYRWCSRWDHRADDPTHRLEQPKVANGLPRGFSRAELDTLLDSLARVPFDDVDGEDPAERDRRRAAVEEENARRTELRRAVVLGAYAGLRVSESAALMWDDVDLELNRARILNSKGAKSRLVPLSTTLLDYLLPNTGGNVITGGARVYTAAHLQRRLNRAIQAAGVEGTSHQLRHRYGTLAYQATGDIIAVGRVMGHSSPVTTAIYAAASDEVADRIAAAVVK